MQTVVFFEKLRIVNPVQPSQLKIKKIEYLRCFSLLESFSGYIRPAIKKCKNG
jgi:hypothetical protein